MRRARIMAVMAATAVMAVACLTGSCRPAKAPAYIASVLDLASGPAAAGAAEQEPELWKLAQQKLDLASEAQSHGDEVLARTLSFEASILFKTAMAVARQKLASGRIEAAQERIEEAELELARIRSLRLDAQGRYLDLMALHDAQQDEAELLAALFEKDRKALAKLDEAGKQTWIEKEQSRLDVMMQAVRATVRAAQVLGCASIAPSSTAETVAAADRAEQAAGSAWDARRPLLEDAKLRAERLLEHTRALHSPEPLVNPAADEATMDRLAKAMAGTAILVSATRRGIVFSIRNPVDSSGALTQEAGKALDAIVSALGSSGSPAVLVEAYSSSGCSGPGCAAASMEAAKAASARMILAGLPSGAVATAGWGVQPVFEPGHCLVQQCPGGRLDVVVLAL